MNWFVESIIVRFNKFCQLVLDDVLLVVYYYGYGFFDEDNEFVFSSYDYLENFEWVKKVVVDLYFELLFCQNGGYGQNKVVFEVLMKKQYVFLIYLLLFVSVVNNYIFLQ